MYQYVKLKIKYIKNKKYVSIRQVTMNYVKLYKKSQ